MTSTEITVFSTFMNIYKLFRNQNLIHNYRFIKVERNENTKFKLKTNCTQRFNGVESYVYNVFKYT